METRDLRYFMEIAKLGSVHAAAERVGRTQPALTKCIKRLEAEIGGKLFFREGRAIELTPLGEDLLRHAGSICRTVDSTVDEMRATASGQRGRLRLGISPTSAHSLLPDIIGSIRQEAEGLRYQVLTGTPDLLRNALRTREVDVVIGPEKEEDHLEFPSFELHDDEVVVAAGAGHPLAGRHATLAQLCRHDWLLPTENIDTRRWLTQRLRQSRSAISVRLEVSSLINMRLNVIRGNFLTFIARSDMFFGELELLKRVYCEELVFRRKIVLLHLADHPLTPAAARFVATVREMVSTRERR